LLSMPWWHMEGRRGRGIDQFIICLGVRGRLVVGVMFQPLYPWKEPQNH
jgi:hypothetical protein